MPLRINGKPVIPGAASSSSGTAATANQLIAEQTENKFLLVMAGLSGLDNGSAYLFTDTDGIDDGSSENYEIVDGALQNTSSAGGYSEDLCTGGTELGSDMPRAAGGAFDGDTGTEWNSANTGSAVAGVTKGYEFSEAKDIRQIHIYNGPSDSVPSHIEICHADGGALTPFYDYYPSVFSGWETVQFDSAGSHTQIYLRAVTGLAVDKRWYIYELEMMESLGDGGENAMTVLTNSVTLATSPDHGKLQLLIEDREAGDTLVVDNASKAANNCIVECSQDGGSTWDWAPLTAVSDGLYASDVFDLTSTGTDWLLRITTSDLGGGYPSVKIYAASGTNDVGVA